MRVLYFFSLLLFLPILTKAQPIIELESFATVQRPVDIAHAGDDRLFVVDQNGEIRIVEADGTVLPSPFLDIDNKVGNLGGIGDEKGLMGLAFHPDYAENGYFYVNYINNSGDTRVSRFSVSDSDPNIADPDSELIILAEPQPFGNHNGGDLVFGPDGYLYIGLGDGGAGGDPQDRSQNRLTLLGKMLRIDVDNGDPYSIPEDNPFAEEDFTLDEIWAIGLRNPWRYSFDRLTGDLWIADVGQNNWEEIDFQPADSPGGENYGWRCKEGFANFNTSGCNETYVDPVHVYSNTGTVGCSITGGYVYRGSEFPDLYGKYVYADYCSGRIWTLTPTGNGDYVNEELLNFTNFTLSSFGEDVNGELYVASISQNRIYKVVEICSSLTIEANVSAASCNESDGAIDLTVNNSGESYTVNWSNDSDTEDISNLGGGDYTVTVTFANGCERVETFEVVSASIPGAEFQFTGVTPVCEGGNLVVEAPEAPTGFGYQWLMNGIPVDGANTQEYLINMTGTYSLIYISEDPEICDSQESDSFEVEIVPNPTVDLLNQGGTLEATAGFANYAWFLNGEMIESGPSNTFEPEDSGIYSVFVSDENGCTGLSDEVEVIILSAEETFGFERFAIAPNPFSNQIYLEIDAAETSEFQLRLLDMQGRLFYESTEMIGMGFRKGIETNNLPSGVYFLNLRKQDVEYSTKLIKQ